MGGGEEELQTEVLSFISGVHTHTQEILEHNFSEIATLLCLLVAAGNRGLDQIIDQIV